MSETSGSTSSPAGRHRRLAIVLSMALVALVTLLFYRQALQFGYFNDDPSGHFAWMEGKSTADFFLSSADYGYYRPVVFAMLRATETLFGRHMAVADHALLLLLHAANVALVWLLAYRLSRKQWAYAWVAALAFLAFPFNYEAVAYVASLTHPLMLFWLLLALHFYIWGRSAGRSGPLIAAWMTLVLALLTHENGMLALPALVGVEWILFRPLSGRHWVRRLWPYAVPVLVYVPLWLSIPKDSEAAGPTFSAVSSNAIPFLQSLVYPLLPLLRLRPEDTSLLILASIVFLVVTGVLGRRASAGALWVFGLGWFVLSSLPAILFLSPDYLYGSPRLSYLASVGVALLWGLPALWLWREPLLMRLKYPTREVVQIAGAAALALVIILPPRSFIRCQLAFYESATDIVHAMAQSAVGTSPDEPLTFVNLPFFFSSDAAHPEGCPSAYPWTPVGAVVVPPYAQARDFVRFNGGPDRAITAVTYEGYHPGWRTVGDDVTGQGMRSLVETSQVRIFDLLTQTFTDLNVYWQTTHSVVGSPLASFGDALNLVEAEIETDKPQINVRLQWQVSEPPSGPLAVFVHLYGPDGTVLAQSDRPPGGGVVPSSLWQSGDRLIDTYQVAIDMTTLPLDSYSVRVGVYDPQTGQRLPATITANGRPITDDAFEIGRIDKTE